MGLRVIYLIVQNTDTQRNHPWMNCFGTFTFAKSGDKYVGEFRNDAFNGHGTITWANGNKYVGEFKDGKMNGQGTYTYAEGAKDVCDFKDGVLNGFATR